MHPTLLGVIALSTLSAAQHHQLTTLHNLMPRSFVQHLEATLRKTPHLGRHTLTLSMRYETINNINSNVKDLY